eukprot:5370400-Prorocentrum_lima.AAC.1
MTSSLVGSEMCIRDRRRSLRQSVNELLRGGRGTRARRCSGTGRKSAGSCLLYTSDAADDM